jgi:hypothetical protein
VQTHPSREDLASYARRLLHPDEATRVADHLEHCGACRNVVAGLDHFEKTLRDRLRTPAAADEYLDEPQCRETLELLRSIGRTPKLLATCNLRPACIRNYKLQEKLGEGGMGVVYKALHTKLRRMVALKLLHPHLLQSASAVARFEREMEAVGQLDDPHIVRASDAGEDQGTHFLVMEYIQGCDVGVLLQKLGPLPVAAACEIAAQAAMGLQHAHQHGLVHRDIKPSNIMVEASAANRPPLVKLLDLGLARLQTPCSFVPGEDLTTAGQVMGTLSYMAPEQVTDSRAVDIRADIYSLGATLFAMLTGQAPFARDKYASPLDQLRALQSEEAPSLASFRRDAPPELIEVTSRMASGAAVTIANRQGVITVEAPGGGPLPAGLTIRAQSEGASVVLSQDNQWRVFVRPGSYRLELNGGSDSFQLQDEALVVRRFGETLIKVTLQPQKIAAKEHADRAVAEWVAANRGTVSPALDDVATEDYRVNLVSLRHLATDSDLARLIGLERLERVSVGSRHVTDAGLEHLLQIPQLRSLTLHGTQATDAGIARFADRSKLEVFNLAGCERILGTCLKPLAALPRLDTLNLQGTQVGDEGLKAIGQMRQLGYLSLSPVYPAKVTDAGLEHLRGLRQLNHLILVSEDITDDGIEHVAVLSNLIYLHLGSTQISDAGIEHLVRLKGLKNLELRDAPAVTDAGLAQLATLPKLQWLSISHADVTDTGVAHLAAMDNLFMVRLGQVPVTDAGVAYLRRLPLKDLWLTETPITDVALEHIGNMTTLTYLALRDVNITDAGLDRLHRLSNLEYLHVVGTKVTSDGVARLKSKLPQCTVLFTPAPGGGE